MLLLLGSPQSELSLSIHDLARRLRGSSDLWLLYGHPFGSSGVKGGWEGVA